MITNDIADYLRPQPSSRRLVTDIMLIAARLPLRFDDDVTPPHCLRHDCFVAVNRRVDATDEFATSPLNYLPRPMRYAVIMSASDVVLRGDVTRDARYGFVVVTR